MATEARPVTSSRRPAGLVLLAMIALIGALIGLRWVSAEGPPPPAAVLPDPATPAPANFPASTDARQSAPPSPSAAPTQAPSPSAAPTPRATDGLRAATVLTTADFQAAFLSGELVGRTFVVDGRLEPIARAGNPPPSADCGGRASCPFGALVGAAIQGSPLVVWARPIAVPLAVGAVEDASWSTTRAVLPLAGQLILRVNSARRVEYLGRAAADRAGLVWAPFQVAGLDVGEPALDEVLLVDGWLAQSTIRVGCQESGGQYALPRHFCGEQAWIGGTARTTPYDGQALVVQPGAYTLFAPKPVHDDAADEYVPRRALLVVGLRLERDGCSAPPCRAWTVLGRLAPATGLPLDF